MAADKHAEHHLLWHPVTGSTPLLFTLSLPLIRSHVRHFRIPQLILQVDQDLGDDLGLADGHREAVEVVVVLIGIGEEAGVPVAVEAGVAGLFEKIGIEAALLGEQLVDADDAVLEFDGELERILAAGSVGEDDLVVAGSEDDGIGEAGAQAVLAVDVAGGDAVVAEEVAQGQGRGVDAVAGQGAVGEAVVAAVE